MTNNYYVIIKEEGILDYVFGTFQTAEINIQNFEIELDQDSVYLSNGNAKYSEEINKFN